jgi:Epoxide hydrolase N terminus
MTTPTVSSTTAARPDIRPFHVEVPEDVLADLRHRISATHWPERETVRDQRQGVQLATIQELARYWGADYDMRRFERKLNAFPQFIAEIDGLRHPPHTRPLPARERATADHHGRLAGLRCRCSTSSARSPTRSRTAAPRRTRSTSWSPPCRATGSRPGRRPRAGTRCTSRRPGSP